MDQKTTTETQAGAATTGTPQKIELKTLWMFRLGDREKIIVCDTHKKWMKNRASQRMQAKEWSAWFACDICEKERIMNQT